MYKNILVSGSLAYDYIMTTQQQFDGVILPEHINHLSVSFLATHKEKHLGGTAGNIAYNLNILLQDPTIVSSLGRDRQDYMSWFSELGFSADMIEVCEECDTAAAYILSDSTHSQIAFFHPGAMSYGVDLIDLSDFEGSIMLIAPDDVPKMNEYASQCKRYGIDYIFDPGQNIAHFSKEELQDAISGAKIVIANVYEFELLKKNSGMEEKDVLDRCETLIITHGENGSEIHRKGQELSKIDAFKPRKLVEPTGAGDAYRAGILAGFKEGWSLEMSAKVGSLLAAYVIEKRGTQNHEITPAEIEEKVGEKVFGGMTTEEPEEF